MGILLDKNSEIAGKEMIAALDAQKSQLEKINALMNPSFLKERIKLEQEVRKQKEQLAALENEEYSKYLKPALTTAQEHQKVLEEINKLNDPKELADRVRMEQEIAQAKKQLASSEEQERSKYIPVLTALEKHKQTLEEINKLNDPKLIADRLRMEKEIADAKRAIANTEASIKRDIEPPKSANALKEIQDRVRLEFQELEVRRWITQEEAKERSYLVMNAQAIEDTVKAERELLALRKQEDDALSKERKRQSTPEEQLQQIGSASGYAGSAIGKSIGGETGGQLGAIVGKAIENIGGSSTIAASGLGLLSSALGGLNSALGPITGGLDLASDIMGSIATGIGDNASQVGQVVGMAVAGPIGAAVGAMLGDALGKQLQQLAKIPAVIGSILSTLTGFAAKASPGQMTMLTMAIDDTQAIIGQSFLPMMELMREAIKFVGDTIATIIPSYDEVQSALAGVRYAFQQVGNEVKNFLQEFGPTIKVMLVNSIKLLGIAATMAAQGLTALIAAFRALAAISTLGLSEVIIALAKLFNGTGTGMASSTGAAARPASITSISSYQQQLQTAAASQPGTVTANQVPSLVGEIARGMGTIVAWTLVMTPQGIADAIRNNVPVPSTASTTAAVGIASPGLAAASAIFNYFNPPES